MNIHNNKNPEHKNNLQKHKLYFIQHYPRFFVELKYNLKRFHIWLAAKPPPKLMNVLRLIQLLPTSMQELPYELPLWELTNQRITILYWIAQNLSTGGGRRKAYHWY